MLTHVSCLFDSRESWKRLFQRVRLDSKRLYPRRNLLSLPPLRLYAVLVSPALTSVPLTVADQGFISSERYVLAPVQTRLSSHLLLESQLQIQSYCCQAYQ